MARSENSDLSSLSLLLLLLRVAFLSFGFFLSLVLNYVRDKVDVLLLFFAFNVVVVVYLVNNVSRDERSIGYSRHHGR